MNPAEIIKKLKQFATDKDRMEYLVNNEGSENHPPLIHELAEKHPQNIPAILDTLANKKWRANVMEFQYKAKNTPLEVLDGSDTGKEIVPIILKFFSGKNRLAFIRREDSDAKEFGDVTNPDFQYINNIIFCDLYIEHLDASLSKYNIFGPEEDYIKLTQAKIKAVTDARAILEAEPESTETMQTFHAELLKHKQLLETRRDTWLTFFLKCVGVVCSAGLAYHSLFVNTDGKALLDKTDTHEPPAHKAS